MNSKLKEHLETIETILAIIVSLIAISGTFIAYQKGFWGALHKSVVHYHNEIVTDEEKIEKKILPF